MTVMPKQLGLTYTQSDLATGGAITLPAGTNAEQYRAVAVNQTTASQTIQIVAPTDTSILFSLPVSNVGSASFTLLGVTVTPHSTLTVTWDGSQYTTEPTGTAPAVPTAQTLVATAQDTLPALTAAPRAGFPVLWFVNGVRANGITNAGTAVTVTSATVGYHIEATDEVTVLYYV